MSKRDVTFTRKPDRRGVVVTLSGEIDVKQPGQAPILVGPEDKFTGNVVFDMPGWLILDEPEKIRRMMHEQVDRLIDRVVRR